MRLIVGVALVTPVAATVNSFFCPAVNTSVDRSSIATWRLLTSKNRTEKSDGKVAAPFARIAYFVMDAGIGSARVITIFQKLLKRTSCVNPESRNKLKPESGETGLVYE